MLENRTYDHVFGARKLLHGLPGDGLTSDLANPDVNGVPVAPYEPTVGEELCVLDPPHGWDRSHQQWNNGAMDGFVVAHQQAHGSTVLKDPMQYFTRTHQPVSWALADAYTTCDRWFASVMGPTLPNRAYWHTGTSFGQKDNTAVLETAAALPVPSIYHRLRDKDIDWSYYFGSLAVVALLGNDGPYKLPADYVQPRIKRFARYADDPGDSTGLFFRDAAAGTLPPVVYIDPYFGAGGNDDHPPTHPMMAQALIAAIYNALARSPQWKNCMLVITYDEHGGFYDHVSPPTTTDDTLERFGVVGFQQLGFRVPAMVAGPYAKQGHVSSVQYDHTSALRHLQNAFELEPLNVRVDAATDLTDCIDMDRLSRGEWAPPIELPTINLADYPVEAPACLSGEAFRSTDPISQYADERPERFAGYDIRGDRESYHETIRAFLRDTGTLK
jgi:phospholipase C